MVANKYSPALFAAYVQRAIKAEIKNAMLCGYTKEEAAIIVAQVTISSALGFTAASMGKGVPDRETVGKLTNRIIGLVAELPEAAP